MNKDELKKAAQDLASTTGKLFTKAWQSGIKNIDNKDAIQLVDATSKFAKLAAKSVGEFAAPHLKTIETELRKDNHPTVNKAIDTTARAISSSLVNIGKAAYEALKTQGWGNPRQGGHKAQKTINQVLLHAKNTGNTI